mgnify:CR=1 FL=1
MTLKEKIETVVVRKDWDRLPSVLEKLTNSEFRRVQPLVREELFPKLTNEEFWEAFSHFLAFRPQAFLSCIHCIKPLAENGTLDFNNCHVAAIRQLLTDTHKQKLATMAFPYLTSEKLVYQLFDALGIESSDTRLAIVVRENTPLSYFILFNMLKSMPDHHEKCLQCCKFILKRNDDLSFNMASILRTYFGLNEIKNQLSLKVEQYELSYLESSFDKFRFVLEGRRPTV